MGELDSLKIVYIGQSAAKPRIEERSTTIPEGSTLHKKGKRTVYPKRVIYKIENLVNKKLYIGSAKW